MLRTRALVLFVLLVAALGCGDDGRPAEIDGGGARVDGGGGGIDGGMVTPADGGGGTGTDGGSTIVDGGGGGGTDGGSAMMGSGAVGDACAMDVDCDGALVCRTMQSLTVTTLMFPGGYCTQDCGGMGAMCPSGAECAGTVGGFGMGFCARSCTSAAMCRSGYECRGLIPGIGGGAMYCLPPSGGGFMFDGGLPGFP